MILTPKNWKEFQHYKDRAPQWIKLHRALLDNYEYSTLPIPSRALAPMLWLLASEFEGGRIRGSLDSIAFRFHMTRGDLADALGPLIDAGFFAAEDDEEAAPAEQGATLSQRVAKSNGFGTRYITDATKREVWERDGGECQECGSSEDIEYDHKIPVSRGGSSEPNNIQLLCRPCNRRKRNKQAAPAEQVDTDDLDRRSLEKEREKRDIDKRERQNGADAPIDPTIHERDYFLRGREVLGKGAGSLIGKLLKSKGGNVAMARAALEQASQKQNPTEYVAAICRGPPQSSKPLTEFQRKQQETSNVTAKLRAYANSSGSGGAADRILSDDSGEQSGGIRGGPGAVVLALPRASHSGGD